jgi:glycosyltransferase involved in cell wall biosynthesis
MGVTVGIVNYNLARFLPRAIESAQAAAEVLVADDCSTDGSLRLARELLSERVGFCIHNSTNSGSAVWGWNALIATASQDWLMLLSADDELHSNTLRIIREHGDDADWLWGDLDIIDVESRVTGRWTYTNWPKTVPECQSYMRRNLQLYPTMVAAFRVEWLRRNNLQAVGFKTTNGYADTLTGWNWLKANPRLKYVPEVLARYRRWGGSETNRMPERAYRAEFAEILRGEG